MNSSLDDLVLIVPPSSTLQHVIDRMGSGMAKLFGIALVVDESMTLLGLINNADILRLIADKTDLGTQVSTVMVTSPVTAVYGDKMK